MLRGVHCAVCSRTSPLASHQYWRPWLRRLPLQKVAEKTGEVWLLRVNSGAEVTTAGEGGEGRGAGPLSPPYSLEWPLPRTLELCPVRGKAGGGGGRDKALKESKLNYPSL